MLNKFYTIEVKTLNNFGAVKESYVLTSDGFLSQRTDAEVFDTLAEAEAEFEKIDQNILKDHNFKVSLICHMIDKDGEVSTIILKQEEFKNV